MRNRVTAADSSETGDRTRLRALAVLKLPRYVLVPGDPDRVRLMAEQWNGSRILDLPRGYRAAVGTYKGVRIGAMSSGIGAPSLEIIVSDLARLGVDTMIRVGTTGTLRRDIGTGSLVINDAAVRLDGTTNFYVRPEYPAAASYEVTLALVDAASAAKASHRVGVGATVGSFLAGQGRPGVGGYRSPEGRRIFEEMKAAGVLNFEMETASLLTLARLYGLRAGSVCSVIANRVTGKWGDQGGIARACLVGAEAVLRLSTWDRRKRKQLLTAADLG
jgi:uridine phosphorylase